MPSRLRSWLRQLAVRGKRFLVYVAYKLETNGYLLLVEDARGDFYGHFWALRALNRLESGAVTPRHVETALMLTAYADPWIRYRAVAALRGAFQLRPDLLTADAMRAIVVRLVDFTPSIRSCALRTCETAWQIKPDVFTSRLLALVCRLAERPVPQPKMLLLSCLPHPLVEAAIGGDPMFGHAGLDAQCVAATNELFRELNLDDLTIGGQALLKVQIYAAARLGADVNAIRARLHTVIVPAIRIVEHLSEQLPTIGMELHRRVKTDDPADRRLAASQAMLANYLNIIQRSHELGESHLLRHRKVTQLEMRTMPACYPIFKLIVDSLVDVGLIPDDRVHFYLSTIQGDLKSEIIALLVATFFLDLPYNRGPDTLKTWAARERDSMSFPGCYTYVGVTLDPHTGGIAGSQSNIINKVIAHNIHLVDGSGETLQVIPTYLYKRDLARKALLAAAAIAYVKPPLERDDRERRLAALYADFRERLRALYHDDLRLAPDQAQQLLGEGYRGGYGPPNGVDKAYVMRAVELLRECLLQDSSRVEALAALLDEAAERVKLLVFGADLAPLVDAFYLGQLREVLSGLVVMLYSTDAERQLEAAQLLGIAGGPQARLALEACLGARDSAIRTAIARSLARIADPDSLPALEAALRREDDPAVRATIAAAIAALADRGQRREPTQLAAGDDG